ncbi:MAG: hypothetical protein OXT74_06190 [Candidatus Poribacteria bacterium]|nr:hypothetical protein [Candidatus Poribacteria bacterium]
MPREMGNEFGNGGLVLEIRKERQIFANWRSTLDLYPVMRTEN